MPKTRGAQVFVRGAAVWILVLGLAYSTIALGLVNAQRLAQAWPDVEWPGLPWGATSRQLLLGAGLLAMLSVVSAFQLWRLTPSGRALGVAYLAIVGIYALAGAWAETDAMGLTFGALNLWLTTVLLRRDSAHACRRPPSRRVGV
jgi:hypothetical protein